MMVSTTPAVSTTDNGTNINPSSNSDAGLSMTATLLIAFIAVLFCVGVLITGLLIAQGCGGAQRGGSARFDTSPHLEAVTTSSRRGNSEKYRDEHQLVQAESGDAQHSHAHANLSHAADLPATTIAVMGMDTPPPSDRSEHNSTRAAATSTVSPVLTNNATSTSGLNGRARGDQDVSTQAMAAAVALSTPTNSIIFTSSEHSDDGNVHPIHNVHSPHTYASATAHQHDRLHPHDGQQRPQPKRRSTSLYLAPVDRPPLTPRPASTHRRPPRRSTHIYEDADIYLSSNDTSAEDAVLPLRAAGNNGGAETIALAGRPSHTYLVPLSLSMQQQHRQQQQQQRQHESCYVAHGRAPGYLPPVSAEGYGSMRPSQRPFGRGLPHQDNTYDLASSSSTSTTTTATDLSEDDDGSEQYYTRGCVNYEDVSPSSTYSYIPPLLSAEAPLPAGISNNSSTDEHIYDLANMG
ncbi:hypothetical protein PTSG_06793 [Salpingoeca rosetta]|uniref:Uncharacterized protein n=1 Tax=Salpingoeca rosetta (strain ATCC 50818 / BSB-021) TaxID=946362 RepID=F2UET8_SALR5|nr:uncharacterized protein PTSG_06793 [Salpingoeca rosetta]EGD75138.1 hypothetical protein PTSG_06793 [Salpingoeca rosetta]|eukprot:XP_004992191.1 hypothetical protein PTSG_06793 [Salpingoeca rosetta]